MLEHKIRPTAALKAVFSLRPGKLVRPASCMALYIILFHGLRFRSVFKPCKYWLSVITTAL